MLIGIIGPNRERNELIITLIENNFQFIFFEISKAKKEGQDTTKEKLSFTLEEALSWTTINYQLNMIFIHSENIEEYTKEYNTFSVRPFYCSLGIKPKNHCSFQGLMTVNPLLNELEYFDRLKNCDQIFAFDLPVDFDILLPQLEKILTFLRNSLRPSWDDYFMAIARLTSQRSNCMKRRVGSVIVSRESHRIISTGYNGTPSGLRNCFEGGCKRCNENAQGGTDLSTCLCLHAEENAIFEAGRDRIALYGKPGVILYSTSCPCIYCTKKIIQAGITEVVYMNSYHMDDFVMSCLKEANIVIRSMNVLK